MFFIVFIAKMLQNMAKSTYKVSGQWWAHVGYMLWWAGLWWAGGTCGQCRLTCLWGLLRRAAHFPLHGSSPPICIAYALPQCALYALCGSSALCALGALCGDACNMTNALYVRALKHQLVLTAL